MADRRGIDIVEYPLVKKGTDECDCDLPFVKEESDKKIPLESRKRSKSDGDLRFNSARKRISSFKQWPIPEIVNPKDLAKSGFFYSGIDDLVFCFDCKLGLRAWELNDDPFIKHKWHSPRYPQETKLSLKFKRISKNAFPPTRGSKLAAGFDLYSAYDALIPPHGKELIFTDIQIAIPHGHYGRIAPRSGLTWEHFIDVGAGVIDEDYRGNIGVILFNFNNKAFKISKGQKIAQLICERISYPHLVELEDLEKTERGTNGFGSTD